MNNTNNFIIIPPTVLYDERLNFTEKALYGLLFGLTQKEGFCFASNEYISGVINVEIRSVQRMLERLENFELIKREQDEKGNRSCRSGYRYGLIRYKRGETLERTAPEPQTKTKTTRKISHLERYANSLVLEKILERAKISTYPMPLKQQRVFGNLIRKRIWDALPEQDRTPERVLTEVEKVCDSFGKDQYHFKNMGDLRFFYYKMVLHYPLFAKTTKKEVYL